MSLFSQNFVRGLRRRVRFETKRHPKWKVEARAARKSTAGLRRFNWRWIVLVFALAVGASENTESLALPMILGWSALLTVARAAQIQALFFTHSESTPLCQFPATERFVFTHAARVLLRSSLWLGADVFVLLGTIALRIKSPESMASSLLFTALAASGVWAATLSGAITLVWIRPRFPYAKVFGLAFFFGIVGTWVAGRGKLITPESISAAYGFAKWWMPSGWVCVLIEPWIPGDRAIPFAAPALLTVLANVTVVAARRLSGAFTFWPPHIESADVREQIPNEPPISRVSEVEDAILTRGFLTVRDWTQGGFIERTASRFLTPREHRVMDLALTSAPGWTRWYPYAWLLILAAACLASIARATGTQPTLILVMGILAGLSMVTPLDAGKWSAFALVPIAHRATAVLNFLPVGLRELRSCILKLNLVRYLFALPCWLLAGGASAGVIGSDISVGVVIAGKSWLLALALQPFFLAFKYSASTTDTSSGLLFVIALLLFTLAVAVAAGATALLSFDPGKLASWLVAFAAAAILAWLFEAAYRRVWRSQQFDLLAKSGGNGFAS